MIAMQTIFGWTLGGKTDQSGSSNSVAAISISMFMNQEKSVADMWQLETLGIRDSADVETRQEHDEQVKRKLQAEITRDKDGRYCVKRQYDEVFKNWQSEGIIEEIEQELRKTPAKSNMVVAEEQPRFSRYLSNVEVFSWIWRFVENSR